MTDALMPAYKRFPIAFTHGQGVWLWDENNTQYLDTSCGLGVTGLGHAHPTITKTISEQAHKLLHVSNAFRIPAQEMLAEKLCAISGLDQAFFCNSGAEANEAAIKLARLYGKEKQQLEPSIIVMQDSFHGRTLATLSASGNRAIQAGYEPLVQGFIRAPYNDTEALQNILHNRRDVVAILFESIQGNAGIHIPSNDYLAKIRTLCDEYQCLMIIDEIQTGIGRTGDFFAYQHHNIIPDIVTTAKGLANGIPIGACLAKKSIGTLIREGKHGSTFGGNPFACQTALSVIETLENNQLLSHTKKLGRYIIKKLQQNILPLDCVQEIRGRGLMIGIELTQRQPELAQRCLELGLIINITAEKVIRLLPPLVMEQSEADIMLERLHLALS